MPYCVTVHSCTLRALGQNGQEVLALLEEPAGMAAIDAYLALLEATPGSVDELPGVGSTLDRCIFAAATVIFLHHKYADRARAELRRLLPAAHFDHLISLLAYNQTCHSWMEAHPDVLSDTDYRTIAHLGVLTEHEPGLATFLDGYAARVARERASLEGLAPDAEVEVSWHLSHLQRLTAALSRAVTVADVATACVSEAALALRAQGSIVAVADVSGARLELFSGTNVAKALTELSVDEPAALCDAFRTGRSVTRSGRSEIEARYPGSLSIYDFPIQAVVAVPFVLGDEALGALSFAFSEPRVLTEGEHLIALAIADQGAQALRRAQAFERERTSREWIQRVQSVTSALAGAITVGHVCEVLLREGRSALGADTGAVVVPTLGGRRMSVSASHGYSATSINESNGLGDHVATSVRRALTTRETVVLPSISPSDSGVVAIAPLAGGEEERSSASVPLLSSDNQVVAVLHLGFHREEPLGPEEVDMLTVIAGQAAQALERAMLMSGRRTRTHAPNFWVRSPPRWRLRAASRRARSASWRSSSL